MGATATAVALCDGLRARRIVMLAPMASPTTYARQFARMLGFGEPTFDRLARSTPGRPADEPVRRGAQPGGRDAAHLIITIATTGPFRSRTVAIAAAAAGDLHGIRSGTGVSHDRDVIARVVDFVTA
jgi:hypothetical protein